MLSCNLLLRIYAACGYGAKCHCLSGNTFNFLPLKIYFIVGKHVFLFENNPAFLNGQFEMFQPCRPPPWKPQTWWRPDFPWTSSVSWRPTSPSTPTAPCSSASTRSQSGPLRLQRKLISPDVQIAVAYYNGDHL